MFQNLPFVGLHRSRRRILCKPQVQPIKESHAMMLKRGCLVVSVFMVASLMITAPVVSAESCRAFRQENGLQAYVPPEWFLRGHFIACEKNPGYVFGPVQNFVGALGGTTTWLIEDMELERPASYRTPVGESVPRVP